jgi:hypothetical protein
VRALLGNRVNYNFYFRSTIPAVCLGIEYGLLDLKNVDVKIACFHNILILAYLVLVLAGFYMYLPVQGYSLIGVESAIRKL